MINFTIGKPIEYHPAFAEQSQARKFWRWSDLAKANYPTGVDAIGNEILPKHERETDDRFSRRQKQAIVRRYVRPIINRYNDFVTRDEPTRPTSGEQYQSIVEDADGAGTDLDSLIKKTLRGAQIDGIAYWLCDANDKAQYETQAQEIEAGKRTLIRKIDADAVVNWREWQDEIVEAAILLEESDGTIFCWWVDDKNTQRVNLKQDNGGKLLVASIDVPQPHNYGGCPLVRLVLTAGETPGEDSQASPLAEGQKRICNIDSWLHEELQGATFTTAVFLGVDKSELANVTVGPGQGLCIPGSTGKTPAIGKLGSDVTQAASMRESLNYEIKELYRCAGLSPGNPTEAAQPESGVAKAFAFNEIEATCSGMADALEKLENRAIYLISKGSGFAYPGDADYPDKFEASDLSEELSLLLQMQAAGLPRVLETSQIKNIATASFNLNEDQQKELDTELAKPKPEPADPSLQLS